MFCSKHVDVKWNSVYFPEIKKTFAVFSLVLNLLTSELGDFFLPNPVYVKQLKCKLIAVYTLNSTIYDAWVRREVYEVDHI